MGVWKKPCQLKQSKQRNRKINDLNLTVKSMPKTPPSFKTKSSPSFVSCLLFQELEDGLLASDTEDGAFLVTDLMCQLLCGCYQRNDIT